MIPKVFLRSAYNYDMDLASDESGLRCEDASLAVQSAKDEVDINTIVRRFGLTGELPSDLRAPTYGDFTLVHDFQSALNAVRSASEAFMQMPADVRARFGNDPGAFVDFCSDDRNRAEAKALGLLLPEAKGEVAAPPRCGAGRRFWPGFRRCLGVIGLGPVFRSRRIVGGRRRVRLLIGGRMFGGRLGVASGRGSPITFT